MSDHEAMDFTPEAIRVVDKIRELKRQIREGVAK